jgi:hypothetical protein
MRLQVLQVRPLLFL